MLARASATWSGPREATVGFLSQTQPNSLATIIPLYSAKPSQVGAKRIKNQSRTRQNRREQKREQVKPRKSFERLPQLAAVADWLSITGQSRLRAQFGSYKAPNDARAAI